MMKLFEQWIRTELNNIDESISMAKKRFIDKNIITNNEFNFALQFDKSSSGKYIEKILELYVKSGNIEIDRENSNFDHLISIGQTVIEFDELVKKEKIAKKDISAYKTLEEIEDSIKDAYKIITQKESKDLSEGNFDIVVDNDDLLVVVPLDHEASKKWGDDTKWCTTSSKSSFWISYVYDRGITLYYIWIKNREMILNYDDSLNEREINSLSKIAVAVKQYFTSTQYECFDKDDYTIEYEKVKAITKLEDDIFESVEFDIPYWVYDVKGLDLDMNNVEENGDGSINYDGDIYLDTYSNPQEEGYVSSIRKVFGDLQYENERDYEVDSLEECYLPDEIGGNFIFTNTYITNLKGCPKIIGGNCDLSDNTKLESIDGFPKKVGGDFDYSGTPLSLSKNSSIRMTARDIRKFIEVEGDIINDWGYWSKDESDEKKYIDPNQLKLFNESKNIKSKLNR